MALKISSVGLKINKSWKEILKMGSYLEWETTVFQMEMFIEGNSKMDSFKGKENTIQSPHILNH